jgi:NAD(P)-dependent dehydrogenase (short-subunit alcohol dehydrogenase family)
MRNLPGTVAVVTGAGSGIGRALAQDLAARGAHVALADVNSAGLDETRRLLGSASARSYVVDVSNASSVQNFARSVEQDFGSASLLINNAGVGLYGTFAELTLEEMEWLIRINFWGVIHGCKFFLPLLQRQPEAHIVNVSSVFGLIGPPGQTMYASSKFAVRGFSESLREELRGTPVRVTCVHPAGVATRIAENARAGAATRPEEHGPVRERFAKVAIIPPAEAARVIVRGILNNKDRVLIGGDAYRIDFLQRLLPVRANALLSAWLMKRFERETTGVAVSTRQKAPEL